MTVLLGPSWTCTLPVYDPILLSQHCVLDSWDSASHGDMIWLASPYDLVPWMASPLGSTWPHWMCLLLFLEWLSQLRFAPCRASGAWTMTGLWDSTIQWVASLFWYNRTRWRFFDAFCSHGFQRGQSFDSTCALNASILSKWIPCILWLLAGNCWHCLFHCFVVNAALEGLWFARIDFGFCLLAPLWHFSQLLLDSAWWLLCECHCLFCSSACRP